MTPIELTELLLSLDDRLLGTAQSVLGSRLMAHRLGEFDFPEFERVYQLSPNERYLLSQQLDDTTLAEALKAASNDLRFAFLRDTSLRHKRRIIGKMNRLGYIRLSVAKRAVEAVLVELDRQRASGAISRCLSDDEIKRGTDAIRAGLFSNPAPAQPIRADIAEVLCQYLHMASDGVLGKVLETADPLDLGLLLLQLRSIPLIERLLTVGEYQYLRELLDGVLALQTGRAAPDPGHPDRRLWQVIAWELNCLDGWEIDTDLPDATEIARLPSGPVGPARLWVCVRKSALYGPDARTRPDPEPSKSDWSAILEEVRKMLDSPGSPQEPPTAAQQRRLDAIEASPLARMRLRSDQQMRRAIARKSNAMGLTDSA